LFKDRAGIDMVHVPYRGGGQALTAVMAGETPIYFAPVAAAMPHLHSRLRAVAVTALNRLPMLHEVPTVAEYGFSGFEAGNSYGLMVPAGTPPDTIAIIHRAAIATLTKLNKRLNDIAYIPGGNRPEEYGAQIKADILKVSNIYHRLGLTPN
jgi:tripartite-type tricarboxylate transporter receptor subunit TctC